MRGEREGNIERVRQWRCCAFRSPPSSALALPEEGRTVTRGVHHAQHRLLDVEVMMLVILALRAPVSPRIMAWPPRGPPRYRESPSRCRCSTATCCCWLRGVRDYDARIWRICDAAAALLFAADAVVVDAAAAAAASRSDGRLTDEGVLPEFGGELDRFVPAKCAAWMYRMRRSSTFGKGARWVCALSLAGGAGCGAGSGMFKPCRHYEFEIGATYYIIRSDVPSG